MPVAMEDVLIEEADATVADAQGGRGETIDIFSMQEGGPKFFFGDAVWRFTIELSQQTYLTDRGLLGAFALATELQRGNHVLTQWGHEMSPFVSGRGVGLSKGGHRKRQGSSTADIGGVKELPRQRLT